MKPVIGRKMTAAERAQWAIYNSTIEEDPDKPASEPCTGLPGSLVRVQTYIDRYEAGEQLHHESDPVTAEQVNLDANTCYRVSNRQKLDKAPSAFEAKKGTSNSARVVRKAVGDR